MLQWRFLLGPACVTLAPSWLRWVWIHAVILGSTHEDWERVRQHVSADDILLLHPDTSVLEGCILTWSACFYTRIIVSLPGKEGCDGYGMRLSVNLSLKLFLKTLLILLSDVMGVKPPSSERQWHPAP